MKILLVVPTYQYKHCYPSFMPSVLFPTGIAYLASAIKNAGHEVIGFNPNNVIGYPSAYAMVKDKMSKVIQDVKPDMVGIGGLCTDYAFIKDTVRIIRDISPDTPIVLGGGIVNNDAEFILNQLHPDFCVVGEGEEVIVQIANALKEGNHNYSKIPNIGYWENDVAVFTRQDFDYGDINQRAFPDYEPFHVQDDYVMLTTWWYRYPRPYPKLWVIITARSCPYSCTFCVHRRGPKYRSRSIDDILQEIKVSYDKYRFNILVMLDELFAVNRARMKEFCSALIDAKKTYGWDFDWTFQTHASASLDRETLELAKEAGCFSFSYGIESASSVVLDSMNKKTKPSQISEAASLCDSVGIGFNGNIIFGDGA